MDETQQQIRVNLDDADDVVCEECSNLYFSPTFRMKRVSALLSPTGKEVIVPGQTFQCTECKHVNKEFIENS